MSNVLPQQTIDLLQSLAQKYETKEFIQGDPVSIPHRYTTKQDIEISAFISSWLAFGKRDLFLKVLDGICEDMGTSPYNYILNKDFDKYKEDNTLLYRFYKKKDFRTVCSKLYNIYAIKGNGNLSMEDVLKQSLNTQSISDIKLLLSGIISFFPDTPGIVGNLNSACKRLCMFLRWMVRINSPVDFGIWNIIPPGHLIIPLDTHVYQQSLYFGLTNRKTVNFITAKQITQTAKQIFPDDPARLDFALFGYGVNQQNNLLP